MTNNSFDIIEAREPVPGSPSLVRVIFRVHEAVSVSIQTWVDFSLKLGEAISEDTYQRLVMKEAETRAKELAFRFLRMRARTVAEMRKHLIEKDVAQSVQQSVIAELFADGFLNDAAFADEFVASKRHKMSRMEMSWRLKQHGVDAEALRTSLDAEELRAQELEAATRIAHKYWRTHQKDEPEKRRLKLSGYLVRRGFPQSVVMKAIQVAMREADAN